MSKLLFSCFLLLILVGFTLCSGRSYCDVNNSCGPVAATLAAPEDEEEEEMEVLEEVETMGDTSGGNYREKIPPTGTEHLGKRCKSSCQWFGRAEGNDKKLTAYCTECDRGYVFYDPERDGTCKTVVQLSPRQVDKIAFECARAPGCKCVDIGKAGNDLETKRMALFTTCSERGCEGYQPLGRASGKMK